MRRTSLRVALVESHGCASLRTSATLGSYSSAIKIRMRSIAIKNQQHHDDRVHRKHPSEELSDDRSANHKYRDRNMVHFTYS